VIFDRRPAGTPPPDSHYEGIGESPAGQLAFGTVVAIVAASALCWLGAQAASLIFGGGPMRVSMAAGGNALLGLPTHWAEPRLAWPPSARSTLPGAIPYWACTLAVATTAAALGVVARRTVRRVLGGSLNSLGVPSHAGFAAGRDLKRLAVRHPEPGRLTLGYARRRLIAAEPQASLAVVGPTGCGKTAGFAIPALLEWEGPVIATSVKGDLLDASLEHRRTRGTVWIYDPTHSSAGATASWSPLEACNTWAGAMRVAAWLCDAAQPRTDTVNDGDYWYTQARKALAPYLHAAARSGRTMQDVVRWIDRHETNEVEAALRRAGGVEDTITALLLSERGIARREELHREVEEAEIAFIREELAMRGGGPRSWESQSPARWPIEQHEQLKERVEAALDQLVAAEILDDAVADRSATGQIDALIAAQSLWRKEPRLRGSVFATVENVLAGYADPGVGRAAERCDIDLGQWLAGDNTIYVVATAHEQARLRPVLTVLVQQAIRSAYDAAQSHGGALQRPCLVLLDEAGNIAPLRDLPGYASTARSHGISLVSIWQDLAQIKAVYGERAQTVLNNHRAKLFGTGIADEATLEYVSRLIGDERRTDVNLAGDLHGGRRSMSEHVSYGRAAPVDVIRRIRPNEAVLLYGSELPVHLRLRPWFKANRSRWR
jgi:type IV secretion system protein VirD4